MDHQGQVSIAVCRCFLECSSLLAPGRVIGTFDPIVILWLIIPIKGRQPCKSIRFRVRQRSNQHCFNDTKNSSVHTDCKCKSKDYCSRESTVAKQGPECIFGVLQELLYPDGMPYVVGLLMNERYVSESPPGCAPCLS